MIRKTLLGLLFVFCVAAIIGTSLENASAIPPFARKYQTNCQTCHTAYPKLNPFGMAYRANGYRFPGGDEVFVKDDPISMGAEANKRLFPKALWPGDLPYLPPIGFTTFSNFYIGEDTETTTEFDGIEEIGLLAGGTFGESISFFLDWRMYQWGPDEGWLDRAFINWTPVRLNDALGDIASKIFNIEEIEYPVGILNIRLGQFEPRATPSLGGHRNLITLKGTPQAVAWPVYPTRNMWGFFPNQKGIEFYGSLNGPKGKGGFEWAAGIVNGEQTISQMAYGGEAGAMPTRHSGRWDDDDYKDFYGRVSYKIGGLGVMGGGEVEESDVSLETWQDGETIFGNVATSAKFGFFYYRGKYDYDANNKVRITRYGADLDWIIWNFNVLGSVVVNWDHLDDPIAFPEFTTGNDGFDDRFKTTIYMAEVDYVAYPWLIPAVRYEWIRPDYAYTMTSVYAADDDNPVTTEDWELLTFELAILARANVKLLAGAVFTMGNPTQSTSHLRDYFRLGVDIAY
jgi:hypothetical protein